VRVPAEDIKQVATVIDGREYRAVGGFFDMPDRDARVHLASANYGSSWNAARGATGCRALGYRCPKCKHGSFFKRCGKCGADCKREA
jgi:hypothetical protein